MFKNVASQKVVLYAFDASTGLPKTGDAANITPYVSIDGGAVTALADSSATEMSSTNAKGDYQFDVSQSETNGDNIRFTGKSSTADIVVLPKEYCTAPPYFTTQSIDSNGRVDVIKVAGTTQTARDIGASVLLSAGTGTGQLDFTSGVVKANAVQLLGTAWLTPGTAGTPDVNAKQIGATAQTGVDLGATRAEPAQGAPGATVSFLAKIDYLYKAWRNKSTQTATDYKLFNDDAATVDHKATCSDDETTFTRGEIATGP